MGEGKLPGTGELVPAVTFEGGGVSAGEEQRSTHPGREVSCDQMAR